MLEEFREQVWAQYSPLGINGYLFDENDVTNAEIVLVTRVIYDSKHHNPDAKKFNQKCMNLIRDMLLYLKSIRLEDENGEPKKLEYEDEIIEILNKKKPVKF